MRAETIYLQFARNIRERCQSDASLRLGLCVLFRDELVEFNKCEVCPISYDHMMITLWHMFRSWKGYSGKIHFPIQIYLDMNAQDQFHICMRFYDLPWYKRIFNHNRFFAKRYIKARRNLLDHIISELEYKVNGKEK